MGMEAPAETPPPAGSAAWAVLLVLLLVVDASEAAVQAAAGVCWPLLGKVLGKELSKGPSATLSSCMPGNRLWSCKAERSAKSWICSCTVHVAVLDNCLPSLQHRDMSHKRCEWQCLSGAASEGSPQILVESKLHP
jgi:hypothetical protein